MATEVAHEPVAARKPLSLNEGVDAISGILSRGAEAAPEEAAPEAKAEPSTETIEPAKDEPVKAEAEESKPKKEVKEDTQPEQEVTSDIELEPAQVAQLLGLDESDLDVDDDGNIQISTKIDGQPTKASIKDIRRSYELAQTHEERLRQLGRDKKAFQDEASASLERLQQQNQLFDQSVAMLSEEYANDFQAVDWTTLRNEDPTEYNSRRMDYDDRRKRVEEYRAKSQQQAQALQQQYQQKLAEQQAEGAKVLVETFQGEAYKNAPAWGDEESQKLAKWIMGQGFSPQDVASVAIPQVFQWARDSMLREEELKAAKETVRKVTKLTKVSKPGRTKPPAEVSKSKINELKSRQRKSGGNLRETTDLIGSLLERGN